LKAFYGSITCAEGTYIKFGSDGVYAPRSHRCARVEVYNTTQNHRNSSSTIAVVDPRDAGSQLLTAPAETSRSASMPGKANAKTSLQGPSESGEKVKATKIAKPAKGSKPNALQQPLQPSEALAAVVGKEKLARGEVVSKVWEYIKANKLQNPEDGREILADDKLREVFGKDKVTMFEMNKHLAQHLK
jgi:chromatin remodeling complex protein RSC6